MRIKLVFAAALVFITLTLAYFGVAEAAINQRYFGDGAIPTPSGGWSYSAAGDTNCFVCHRPGGTLPAPDKTSYLSTGHKNILRKATVFSTGTGPDGLPYDTDDAGHVISWNQLGPISLGTSTTHPPLLGGSCSLNGYVDQSSCQAAGGTWTPGNTSLFYMFSGWMNRTAATGAYNAPGTSIAAPGSVSSGGSYSCARCHATGVVMASTVSTTRQPERTYPGINGNVNFDPDGNGPATTVSWASGFTIPQAMDGVQCERCHNAQNHFSTGPTTPRDANATALCLQCHRQEHTVNYIGGGIGANINPTPSH